MAGRLKIEKCTPRPVFTASQPLVDTIAPLNSFFGNFSNLHQHFTIAPCRSTKSLSSMLKPCDQTVSGRPDFMINVYLKATETPLKADSPRLGTISSSLGRQIKTGNLPNRSCFFCGTKWQHYREICLV